MNETMKKCPYCGEDILAIAKKCKHCGEWLNNVEEQEKQMIACPACGEMINEETKQCPYCHEDLEETVNPEKTEQNDIEGKKDCIVQDNSRSFFDYYIVEPYLQNYATFNARMNRHHYFVSLLVWEIIFFGLFLVFFLALAVDTSFVYPLLVTGLFGIYGIGSIIPLYATATRRLRDADSAPSDMAWGLLIFASPLILFWICKPSEDEDVRIDGLEPDVLPKIKFKKSDVITLGIILLLFILGIASNPALWEDKATPSIEKTNIVMENSELLTEAAIDEEVMNEIVNAYVGLLKKYEKTDVDEYGTCNGYYFLYDITGDDIPELWIISGVGIESKLSIYTYENGISVIEDGTEGTASYSSFHKGENYIIQVRGHFGYASWTKLTYHDGKIEEKDIFEEDLNESEEQDYTEPTEPLVECYSFDNIEPVYSMFEKNQ